MGREKGHVEKGRQENRLPEVIRLLSSVETVMLVAEASKMICLITHYIKIPVDGHSVAAH